MGASLSRFAKHEEDQGKLGQQIAHLCRYDVWLVCHYIGWCSRVYAAYRYIVCFQQQIYTVVCCRQFVTFFVLNSSALGSGATLIYLVILIFVYRYGSNKVRHVLQGSSSTTHSPVILTVACLWVNAIQIKAMDGLLQKFQAGIDCIYKQQANPGLLHPHRRSWHYCCDSGRP